MESPQPTHRDCSKCGANKPIAQFRGFRKTGQTRCWNHCNDCRKAGVKAWRKTNHGKRWGIVQKLSKYRLTIDEYEAMFTAQGGVCAICRKPEPAIDPRTGTRRLLSVDHNHATGVHRELLCTLCNQGIGQFKEDPALLEAAIAYIKKHSTSL
jgi:Autographiviridae endonuclease VII